MTRLSGWITVHPGGLQDPNVSFLAYMWFHAAVLTRTSYIDN
jgi:hypothetical protein